MDFTQRSTQAELMDSERVEFRDFRACLQDLERINRLTFAYRSTVGFLDRIALRAQRLDRPLEVVDVGSGYGDTLRQVARWAKRRRIAVSLTGLDVNPWSARAAAEANPSGTCRWVTSDVFAYAPPHGIDVVISSLFTHHLSDALVVRFLQWMEQHARMGWFISDLHRHPLPYHVFHRLSRLARFHRFVQHDGPVSIARAFVVADWRKLLVEAHIDPASSVEIAWGMPFRLNLARLRPWTAL